MAELKTFFGEISVPDVETTKVDEAETDEVVVETTTEEVEEVETTEEKKPEEESSVETEDKPEEEVTEIESVIQELADKGVVEFDPEKEYEFTPETLTELIGATKEKVKATAIDEYKSSMVGESKELFETLEKGGTVDDFLISKQEVDYSQVRLETEDGEDILVHQRNIIEDSLLEQGFDKSSISEMIDEFEESGKLKVNAERHKALLEVNQMKNRDARIEASKVAKEKAESERVANATAFKDKVMNLSELSGFQIPAEARTKLHKYVTEVDGSGQTAYAKALNEDTQLLNAYLTMVGYDKEKLAKSVETKVTSKIRKKLSNYTDKNAERKSEKVSNKKDVPIGEFKGWR